MSGSAQTQTFQIEDLLHSYGEALAARRALDVPVRKAAGFDGRSLMAGFLAVFVFAPGCAAAAVFLLNAEDRLPVRMPESHPSLVSKSNRLPLSQWRAKAPVEIADIMREVAPVADDASFLGPVAIRGRLEEEILAAALTEAAAPAGTAIVPPKPRRRHEARRARPASVVAEAVVPEPAPPSLLEKLFALRIL